LNILISRTDKLGDVALTLPLAGWLKKEYPGCHLCFLGRTYTKPLIELSPDVDEFLNWDLWQGRASALQELKSHRFDVVLHIFPNKEFAFLAKQAQIPIRVGTAHRWYHWLTCTIRPRFSRKNSLLHESELNFKLLSFAQKKPLNLAEIKTFVNLRPGGQAREPLAKLLGPDKINIILHPKSKGSAREWPLHNFSKLIQEAPPRFQFFISGGAEERDLLSDWIKNQPGVIDITGQLSLADFCNFIAASDGIIAASTGPLHIASSLGRQALGIFPPIKPMDPGRWAPIGPRASYLVAKASCSDCRNSQGCPCMDLVKPELVIQAISQWKKL